jgi:hypothetical protein
MLVESPKECAMLMLLPNDWRLRGRRGFTATPRALSGFADLMVNPRVLRKSAGCGEGLS